MLSINPILLQVKVQNSHAGKDLVVHLKYSKG